MTQTDSTLKKARNRLLQESLRPGDWNIPIHLEYPLALGAGRSLYLLEDGNLKAHLNLLERNLLGTEGLRVGLIGNVATKKESQKQGFMKQLLDYGKDLAKKKGLDALILWSDQNIFYEKMGFHPFGQEKRYHIKRAPIHHPQQHFVRVTGDDLTQELKNQLQALRPKVPYTLERSLGDFKSLLSIPYTILILGIDWRNIPVSYGILGKGYDMQGVVHEWGAVTLEDLQGLLGFIMDQAQLTELTLLAPGSDQTWNSSLQGIYPAETHPVGWVYRIEPRFCIEDLYIWGLDSI